MARGKSKPCFFFTKLPRYLRDRIYELVCRPDRDLGSRLVGVNEPRGEHGEGRRLILHNAVKHVPLSLAVSHQFYEEVARYVFRERIIVGNAAALRHFLRYMTADTISGKRPTFMDEVRLIKARYITEVAIDTTASRPGFDVDMRETLKLLRDYLPKLRQLHIVLCGTAITSTLWTLGIPTAFDVHGLHNVHISFYKGAYAPFLHRSTLEREHMRNKLKSKLTRELVWSLRQPKIQELKITSESKTSFLDLPAEIRLQILRECLTVRPHDPDRWVVMAQRKADSPRHSVLEILLTCRSFYMDACDLFYSQNMLCFKHVGDLHLFMESINPRIALDSYHAKVLRRRKQSLRSVVVSLGVYVPNIATRNKFSHDCKQAFFQLSDCANLDRLLIINMRDRRDDHILQHWSRRCKSTRILTYNRIKAPQGPLQIYPDVMCLQKRVDSLESVPQGSAAFSDDQAV